MMGHEWPSIYREERVEQSSAADFPQEKSCGHFCFCKDKKSTLNFSFLVMNA
jgi:hypothetical protein